MNSMASCIRSAMVQKNRVAVMKMQFLVPGIVATGLFLSTLGVAHGGSWGGHGGGSWGGHGGGSWGGHGGGSWGGHGHGFWGGRGHGFHRGGRFFGPGFGFYGYGYPWWWGGYYPSYPYYPYPYYGDPYYGDAYYGNPYYGNPYYGNPYYGDPYYGDTNYGNPNYGDRYYENRDARSSATKAVQAALARRGYYRGSIDGALGPETRNAIRLFQAHQGLPVTGQLDGRLIRALQS
jgi:Putative peptidoglycan binding domain